MDLFRAVASTAPTPPPSPNSSPSSPSPSPSGRCRESTPAPFTRQRHQDPMIPARSSPCSPFRCTGASSTRRLTGLAIGLRHWNPRQPPRWPSCPSQAPGSLAHLEFGELAGPRRRARRLRRNRRRRHLLPPVSTHRRTSSPSPSPASLARRRRSHPPRHRLQTPRPKSSAANSAPLVIRINSWPSQSIHSLRVSWPKPTSASGTVSLGSPACAPVSRHSETRQPCCVSSATICTRTWRTYGS